jgi:translocation and assembly module TamB
MRRKLVVIPAVVLAAILAMTLCLLAGTGAWVAATQGGSARAVAFAAARVPETISYGRVEGTLARRLVLHDVELRFGADVVRLERLALSLRLADLLGGRVGLDDVEVTNASYVRGRATEIAEPHAIVTPIPLAVHGARVGSLTVKVGDTELLFTHTAAAARWSGEDVELDHVETASAGFEAAGSGRIVLTPAIELAANLQWSGDLAGRRFAGRAAIAGTLPELGVQGTLALPFAGGVTGRIDTAGETRFDLDFEWTNFEWPGLPVPTSPTGTLAMRGTWSGFDFQTRSRLVYAGEQAELAASGRGAGASLGVERFSLETADGTVQGSGTVDLAARDWDLAVASNDADSSRLFPDWPSRGRVGGRFHGRLVPGLEWSFERAEVDGVLRGHPIRAAGSVAYAPTTGYVLEGVRIESGRDAVGITGSVGARRIDLAVSVDVEEIAAFLPEALGAEGRLSASFNVRGALDDPRIEGTASAVDAKLHGYHVARLTLVSKLGTDAASPLELRLRASGLLDGGAAVDALEIDAEGTLLAHRVTATARSAEWTGRAVAAGTFKDAAWQGRIERLDLSPAGAGPWTLAAPADLRVGRTRAQLSSSCLAQNASRVCAALDLAGRGDDRLRVTAERFDLAALAPFLPAEVSLNGMYALDATLTNLGAAPSGSLELTGGKTRIEIGRRPGAGGSAGAAVNLGSRGTVRPRRGDSNGGSASGSAVEGNGRAADAFGTDIDAVAVTAELDRGRLALHARVSGRETGELRLEAAVDDVREAKSPVRGELRGEWPDLAFLAMLSPSVGRVGGSLTANLSFGGTLDAPAVEGKASWREGTVAVPDWGLVVEHIEGEAASADGSAVEYRAAGRVGDGELTLTGVTKLEAQAGLATSLTLRGDSLRVIQLPEAEIYASPELAARVKLPDIYVEGTVTVPRANITLETLPAQAVAPSSDTVLHGAQEVGAPAEPPHPLHLHSNIRVVLGDAVKYAGVNLATSLTGQLQLAYDTGRSATAAGRLNVAGSYSAYGQSLKLDRGELLFNGPIDNPALDVRAVRTVASTTVGIELTGMLRAPATRIFSTPAMSEADALSYLLFGRPLRGAGGAEETQTLQTAAISMGLQQALPVVQRIGETLGLDELTVGSTDTDAGALMAGKYLSPKVYIRYSYGLFNRIGGLLLRFKVNDRLSLETRSGDEKSMDLLYTVEKK